MDLKDLDMILHFLSNRFCMLYITSIQIKLYIGYAFQKSHVKN